MGALAVAAIGRRAAADAVRRRPTSSTRFLAPTFQGSRYYDSLQPTDGFTLIGLLIGAALGIAGIALAYLVWVAAARHLGAAPAALRRRPSPVRQQVVLRRADRARSSCGRSPGSAASASRRSSASSSTACSSAARRGIVRAGSAAVRAIQSGLLRAYAALLVARPRRRRLLLPAPVMTHPPLDPARAATRRRASSARSGGGRGARWFALGGSAARAGLRDRRRCSLQGRRRAAVRHRRDLDRRSRRALEARPRRAQPVPRPADVRAVQQPARCGPCSARRSGRRSSTSGSAPRSQRCSARCWRRTCCCSSSSST